jgi:choline-glycine betaine transporter
LNKKNTQGNTTGTLVLVLSIAILLVSIYTGLYGLNVITVLSLFMVSLLLALVVISGKENQLKSNINVFLLYLIQQHPHRKVDKQPNNIV